MYCPSCGLAIAPGLTFCNHCGARLAATVPTNGPVAVRPEILVAAMAAVFIFGIPVISLLVVILTDGVHLAPGLILAVVVFAFLMMAALEATFIRLLFRRGREKVEMPESTGPVTKQLNAINARALPQPLGSVTEHTTRTFDPIYSQRSAK